MHMLDICQQVCVSMLRYIEYFLTLFKNPLKAFVALLAAFIVFWNAFAIVYTYSINLALGIVCPLRLPFVHDRVYRGWDLTRRDRQKTSITSAEKFNAPSVNLIQYQNASLSYGLPHLLSRWHPTAVLLRARLPESILAPAEEVIVHEMFTAYIDKCDYAID